MQEWDEQNQAHRLVKNGFDFFFLSEIIYIRMFLFVQSEVFACILIHALVLPVVPYRFPPYVSRLPFVKCLKTWLNAPFFVKKVLVFAVVS